MIYISFKTKDNNLSDLFFGINCKEFRYAKKLFFIQYAVTLLKGKNNLKAWHALAQKKHSALLFQTLTDVFYHFENEKDATVKTYIVYREHK